MAENGNDPNKQGERDGKIHAPTTEEQGAVSINSESHFDELLQGLQGINSKLTLPSFGVGNATAGNNQQLGKENLDEELAPRTDASENAKTTAATNNSPVVQTAPPKIGEDDVLEEPEEVGDINLSKTDSADSGGDDATPPTLPEDPTAAKEAAKTDAALAQNAKGQGNVDTNSLAGPEQKEEETSISKGIAAKFMGKFKEEMAEIKEPETTGQEEIEEALEQVAPQSEPVAEETTPPPTTGSGDGASLGGDGTPPTTGGSGDGASLSGEEITTTTTGGGGGASLGGETEAVTSEGGGGASLGGETEAVNTEGGGGASLSGEKDAVTTEGGGGASLGEKKEPEPDTSAFGVELSEEEDQQLKDNDAANALIRKKGLDVGRSVGYGAKISDQGKTFTPFGPDEASASQALAEYRDNATKEAQAQGDKYYNVYATAYNEGMEEGIALKKEADGKAREAALSDEKKTTEYKAGMLLGTACGAASAKGEKEIDVSYEIPKEGADPEKVVVKGPMAPVRSTVMGQKQTPDGKLKGDALERAFMQAYNMAQYEGSTKKAKGPEKDADYQAGYERGYKLGGQLAEGQEGDPALQEEKKSYNTLPADAPKPQLQQKNGFYAGYNKGQIAVEDSKAAKKKADIKARNENPIFMSGFATGNMQGFLKAMLDPAGINLLDALNNPAKMQEGGIPEYFPIPEALRTNIKALLGAGGGPAVTELLGKSLFQEGQLMGFNQGYGRGEQSRMTFKREQFRLHPDYQESQKIVHKQEVIINGEKTVIERNMGDLKAFLTEEQRDLQNKEEPTDTDKKKLATYSTTLQALEGEVSKQTEFYQRGVVDSYNSDLDVEHERIKERHVREAHNDPQYKEGFKWGDAVAIKVFKSKGEIKDYRRRGLPVNAHNKKLNGAIQGAQRDARKKGKKYFDGYARGYSDRLRQLENAKKSDMGNQMEDMDKIIKDAGVELDFVKTHKNAAQKAFKDGAEQGYNLYFSKTQINVETGVKPKGSDIDKVKEKHFTDKEAAYSKDKELKNYTSSLIALFKKGYGSATNTGSTYGAGKGKKDATDFNDGFEKATEDVASGAPLDEEKNIAYKTGYRAGKKRAQFRGFRDNMINTQQEHTAARQAALERGEEQEALPTTDNANHTDHAATEGSIADNSALGNLQSDEAKETVPLQTETAPLETETTTLEMVQQEGVIYILDEAAHEAQARGNGENIKWVTKAIYLKKGITLEGTPFADATVSINVLKEGGEAPEEMTLSNKEEDVQTAADFYSNKANYINQLAEAYTKTLTYTSEALRREGEMAEKYKDSMLLSFLKKAYDDKLESIKQAYIRGYNALVSSIEGNADPSIFTTWNHDVAYIEGVRSLAADHPEVKKLILPTPPTKDSKVNVDSGPYQEGYLEGMRMGQRIKSGLIDMESDELASIHGADYERGYKAAQAAGLRTGQRDYEEKGAGAFMEGVAKESFDKDLASANSDEDPEFGRGYSAAYLEEYYRARDYYYGIHLGHERVKANDLDGEVQPEEGIVIKDSESFFDGFTIGRDQERSGKEEGATGEGDLSDVEKFKLLLTEIAWRDATLDAIKEIEKASPKLEFQKKLPLVFGKSGVYSQFAKNKSMKAIANAGQIAEEGDDEYVYQLPSRHTTDPRNPTSEEVRALLNTKEFRSRLPEEAEEFEKRVTGFIDLYPAVYEAVYFESLTDMSNLSMIMAMTQGGVAVGGVGGEETDNSEEMNELLKQLEALFANGSHQNFIIDELDLIDRFYDLERRIEDRHGPIRSKLEDVENYRLMMEYYEDADSTLAAAEIQQLEGDIQDLKDSLKGATPAEKKEINKEKRELVNELNAKRRAQRLNSGDKANLQRDWEKAEEEVKEEIDGIRIYMEDNLGFETPLESNDDILEYIKINLETSDKQEKGERVYQDLNLFNNLVLNGSFDYNESSDFDAFVVGDGSLRINAEAEKMKVEGVETNISREGFKFTAKGLEHDQATNSFTLFEGNLVTPKIEGGRHAGVKLDYDFSTFRLQKGYTIKSQIETQLDKLQGG